MAERLIVPGTAPAKSEVTTSPILAMHRRFEAAWQEYNQTVDASRALGKSRDDEVLEYHYQTAKLVNNTETDALRQAILYQVPTTWPEAMILLYHIRVAFDLTDKPSPEEYAATEVALDTLLDFMCCEVDQDHEAIGKQFQMSANFAFDRRRYRTGIVEEGA